VPEEDFPEIDAATAIALVNSGAWLLDVREQDEWDAGHAEAAHLIPMSVIQDRVDELPDDQPVYVICHSGGRSRRVTGALLAAGYDVVNVAHGMLGWQSAGGVVVSDGPDAPRV
jgi:rhodanese-related sulfurtransferase